MVPPWPLGSDLVIAERPVGAAARRRLRRLLRRFFLFFLIFFFSFFFLFFIIAGSTLNAMQFPMKTPISAVGPLSHSSSSSSSVSSSVSSASSNYSAFFFCGVALRCSREAHTPQPSCGRRGLTPSCPPLAVPGVWQGADADHLATLREEEAQRMTTVEVR